MEISDTPMDDEIRAVQNQTTRLPIYGWRLEINAGDEIVVPARLVSLDIERDYDLNFADRITATIKILGGTFIHKILPHRWNLTGTLYQEPLTVDNNVIAEADTGTQEVTVSLIDSGDQSVTAPNNALDDEEDANRTVGYVDIQVQLSDPVLEYARMISVGGVYRDTNVQDLVKYLMKFHLDQIRSDNSTAATYVKMYEASNSAPISNIVIPHGLPMTEIPDFIHERVAGIYSSGLGHFLQDNTWHIYPLYDITRFDRDPRGLTIINLPTNRYPKIERSFRTTANQVIVLCSGDGMVFDDSEKRQLNDGNGVRYSNASKMMTEFAEVSGNKATAVRSETNSEYITQDRANKRNNVRLSNNSITDNAFLEASKLARSLGTYASKVWENSDPRLIKPGMPVRWMYMDGEEWVELHGVLHGAHHYIQATEPSLTTRRHICTTALRVFLERPSATGDQ